MGARACQQICAVGGRCARRIGTPRHPRVTRSLRSVEACSHASPRSRSTGSIRARSGSRSTSARGLPAFTIVGLGRHRGPRVARPDRARRSSTRASSSPTSRITANLAPAFLRKVGPGFDAALALGGARRQRADPARRARPRYAVFGELSLGGELRDSPGALAVAEGAARAGLDPADRPARARRERRRWSTGLAVAGVSSLRAAADVVVGAAAAGASRRAGVAAGPAGRARPRRRPRARHAAAGAPDRGRRRPQPAARGPARAPARRCSPAGCRRSCRAMTRAEAIEVTRIHSVAGLHADGLITRAAVPRPAPHDLAGRAGRRRRRRRGRARRRSRTEACCSWTSCRSSSARRSTRCASRSRTARVTIVRGQRALRSRRAFMLVAATNPCPCGFAGVGDRCSCGEAESAATGASSAGRCSTAWTCWSTSSGPTEHELRVRAGDDVRRGPGAGRRRPRAPARPPARAPARPATARWTRGCSAATCSSTSAPSDALGSRLLGRRAERPRPPPGAARSADDRRPRAPRAGHPTTTC